MTRLFLATRNPHKLSEIQAMCKDLDIDVEVLPDDVADVVEDRDTFRGNAAKKALECATAVNALCLSDDSGLVVHALDGAPGVYSARYAGEDCDDANNNAKLSREMADVPADQRSAEFVCVMVLADPEGVRLVVEGRQPGWILDKARGFNGFGYDPLFEVREGLPVPKTFAEMTGREKNSLSHRGRALNKLVSALPFIL